MNNSDENNFESSIMEILSHDDLTKSEIPLSKNEVQQTIKVEKKADPQKKPSLKVEIIVRVLAGFIALCLIFLYASRMNSLF